MPIKSLSQSSLTNFQKYSSMLAGNAAFSPSAYDLLETQVLTSSASSVTFTGLDSYSDYKHLQIRAVTKGSHTSFDETSLFRLNSDSGSNYAAHRLQANGSTVFSNGYTSQTSGRFGILSGSNGGNLGWSATVWDLMDFSNTSKYKTSRSLSGMKDAASIVLMNSALWMNTAAVTSIEIIPNAGNYLTGSRFSLYGRA